MQCIENIVRRLETAWDDLPRRALAVAVIGQLRSASSASFDARAAYAIEPA